MATPFLQIVPQRGEMDCSVSCLAMLLGHSYEQVLMQFRHNVFNKGATYKQMIAVAARLGHTMTVRRRFDLETDTGLLCIESPKWAPLQHIVVLKDGLIVDTDATVWEVDVFLAAYSARAVSLLALAKEEDT